MAIQILQSQTINGQTFPAFAVITGLDKNQEARLVQGGGAVDLGTVQIAPAFWRWNGTAWELRDPANNPVSGAGVLTVTGGSTVGSVLTASLGLGWMATGYQWQRSTTVISTGVTTAADISGATSSTYTLQAADASTSTTVVVVSCRASGLTYFPTGKTVSQVVATPYDVILLIGQSNMAGRGTYSAGTDTTDPKVSQWGGYSGDGTYQTIFQAVDRLKHPELGAQSPGVTLVGPGMFFGKAYAARTGRNVLLVPCAWGGTALVSGAPTTWSPYGSNNRDYLNAIAQANAAIAASGGTFVGCLWIQGEADGASSVSQSAYESALTDMIAGLRAGITGATNSWFVIGQMMPEAIVAQGGTYAAIDAGHKRMAATLTRTAWAAIGTGYNSGDNLHYSAAGARLMGTTMDGRVTDAIARVSTNAPGQVLSLAAGSVSSSTVPLTWAAPQTGGPTTDYVVQYKQTSSGTWLTFADGTSTSPSTTVTGLTASTSYDFRVAALNGTGTGTYSATVAVSTSAAATVSNVRLTTQTLLTESGDGTAGYSYTAATGATFTANHAGTSDKKLPAGTDGYFALSMAGSTFNTADNWMLGIVTTQSDPAYNTGASGYLFAVYAAGTQYSIKINGSATTVSPTTVVAPALGDIMRLRRVSGSWVAEVAPASDPTNFTVVYSYATTNNADVWCAVSVNNSSGASKTRGPLTGGNVA